MTSTSTSTLTEAKAKGSVSTTTAALTPAAAASKSFVAIGCYGSGRGKCIEENEKEAFVPSKALTEIMNTNAKLGKADMRSALLQLGGSALVFVVSVLLLAYSPWYFLPVTWVIAAFALSNLFVIGHDCAHGNWSPNPLLNDVIGELSFLPLLQPFESFKLNHSRESGMVLKSELPPVSKPKTVAPGVPTNAAGQSLTIEPAAEENTEPLPWWLGEFTSYVSGGFKPTDVPQDRATRVYISIGVQVTFLALLLPFLFAQGGVWSLIRHWVMPLLAYRAMSTAMIRLWSANMRAFLPRDNPAVFKIASYNWMKFGKALSYNSQFGESVQNSSLFALYRLWAPRINWLNVFILSYTPIISMVGFFLTPMTTPTLIWSIVYYFFTGLGITAGYHRLFAHRAYSANAVTRFILMLAGSGALEGSIKWWCSGHRVHHRFTDTPKDPYNAIGGFFYAHVGWMIIKPDPKNYAKADIRDLMADPIIRFQHKYYLYVGPFMAFVFPTLVAGLGWGDWMGGYFFAGAFRLLFVHHSTFCVNSVAHYFGEHTFDDARTPRDHVITALLTLGEGYHNFHHEFPNDYRNGIQWYHYDPTKWVIALLAKFGMTYNLKVFPKNEIKRGVLLMREKKLAELRANIVTPTPTSKLPQWSWTEYVRRVKEEKQALVAVGGIVHDVTAFLPNHPGSESMLRAYLGQDATNVFYGKTQPVVYQHSHAAENLLSNMRVATIDPATIPTPSDKPQQQAE